MKQEGDRVELTDLVDLAVVAMKQREQERGGGGGRESGETRQLEHSRPSDYTSPGTAIVIDSDYMFQIPRFSKLNTSFICYKQNSVIANMRNKTNPLKGPTVNIDYRQNSVKSGI